MVLTAPILPSPAADLLGHGENPGRTGLVGVSGAVDGPGIVDLCRPFAVWYRDRVWRDHCHERPPVSKDPIFLAFQYS